MVKKKIVLGLCALIFVLGGCSRQQNDWQKTREMNTADAYEQFLKKYPSGEFTAQAQARAKELYEERDWQKARDADTADAYQAFLKQYPEGKWTEEARIRVENFTLAQAPGSTAAGLGGTAQAGSDPSAAAASAAPGDAADATPVAAPATAPKPTATAVAAKPAAVPKTASNAGAGSYGIQLGAFKTGAGAAKEHWTLLQQKYPSVLTGLSSKVIPKKTADGSLYRLQATGLTEKHARDVCTALKAKAEPCVVVPPADG